MSPTCTIARGRLVFAFFLKIFGIGSKRGLRRAVSFSVLESELPRLKIVMVLVEYNPRGLSDSNCYSFEFKFDNLKR